MKIAIYCRVNSKNQLSESFEEQEVKVKGFCKELGVDIVGVLREIRSGYDPFTEDFMVLMQAIKNKKLDGIAVTDAARITRKYDLFKKFWEDMHKFGGAYISLGNEMIRSKCDQQRYDFLEKKDSGIIDKIK